MADRYAVNISGTVNYSPASTAIWSDVSGGSSGFSVPTSADNVFFDANSGSGVFSVGNGVTFTSKNLDTTGFTGSLVGFNSTTSIWDIFGSLLLASATTVTSNISTWRFSATDDNGGAGYNITTNGKVLGTVLYNGAGGKWNRTDALTCNSTHTTTFGTVVVNGFTTTCTLEASSNSNTRSIVWGSATLNLTATSASTYINYATITGFTLSAASLTVNIVNGSANGKTFALGSTVIIGTLNYTNNASTGGLTINNTGRIKTLNVSDATNGRTITISSSPVIDVFNVQGGSGRVMTVASNTGGVQRTISLLGPGPQTVDYVSFTDIRIANPYKLFVTNGTDGGGNRNINFTSAPSAPLNRQSLNTIVTPAATSYTGTFEYPTVAGNKIIAVMPWSADPGTVTTPTGYSLDSAHNRSTNTFVKVYSKTADGSETGFSISWTNSVIVTPNVWEINNFSGTLTFDTDQKNDSVSASSILSGAGVSNASAPAIAIMAVSANGGMGATTTEATNSFQDDLSVATNTTSATGKTALKPLTSVASQSTTLTWTTSRVPASTLAIYRVAAQTARLRMLMGVGV